MAAIGVNTFLWTTTWNDRGEASVLLGRIKDLGFDAVQIPILNLDSLDPAWLGVAVADAGLRCFISAGLKPQTDVTSPDDATRSRGIQYLKRCVAVANELGCSFLSGSFHSVFGMKSEDPVGEAEWERSAACLREVARDADRRGMDIALEPINRYESFVVNTCAQAMRMISLIGEPNVKVQLDTFHMNIEEEDPVAAIRQAGDSLVHFHVAENHRGRFGTGTIPWGATFDALRLIRYRGAIVIESFVPQVTEVATAACIWREMAPSADVLAREGAAFLRDLAKRHGL